MPQIKAQGLGLAAISYDPPEVTRTFSERFGIEFPLLSDPGSVVIRRFGLLNREVAEGTSNYGIPYPGTFIVNRAGVVTHRFFEAAYQERDATSSMLMTLGAGPAGQSASIETPHLRATVAVSDATVSPGHHFAVVFDVEPQPGMHVYAKGDHSYRPFAPLFDPQPGLVLEEMTWPPPREYFFEPLNERVPVYDQAFRIVQPMMLKVADGNELLKTSTTLTISGTLSYQACDDKICYLPQRIPFRVTVGLKPLIRGRLR